MYFQQTDQTSQLLEKRFKLSDVTGSDYRISMDMHMELMIAFNDPLSFEKEAFKAYPIQEILDYLKATHVYYLSDVLKTIRYALDELTVRGEHLQHLQQTLFQFFNYFENDLIDHVQEEEQKLFPYIQQLIDSENGIEVKHCIRQKIALIDFLLHHDSYAEDLLERLVSFLRKESKAYSSAMSLNILIHRLEFFLRDLQVHTLMEEGVLIPVAIELEKRVLMKD